MNFHRCFLILIAGILFAGTANSEGSAKEDKEILTSYENDFETLTALKEIKIKDFRDGKGELKLSENYAKTGKYSLEMFRDSENGHSVAAFPEMKMPVKKGEILSASIWCVNFSKIAGIHIVLNPGNFTLKRGVSGVSEWGDTLKIKWVADKDYDSVTVKLWCSDKGNAFFDSLKLSVNDAKRVSLFEEIPYKPEREFQSIEERCRDSKILVFKIPSGKKIYSQYIPSASEILKEGIELDTARGLYESLNLGIYNSSSANEKYRIEISELKDEKGNVFDNSKILFYAARQQPLRLELRGYDYTVGPKIFDLSKEISIKEHNAGQSRIVFNVSADVVPGIYKGKIIVIPENGKAIEHPLRLNVLPFNIIEPDVERLMWCGGLFDKFKDSPEKMKLYFDDMKRHGMTTLEGALMPVMNFKNDGNLSLDFSKLEKSIDLFKEVFGNKPFMVKGANNIGSTICRKIKPSWKDNSKAESKLSEAESEQRWKLFDQAYGEWSDYLKAKGIMPLMYAYDEPANHPWREQAAATIEHCKKVRPDVKTAITTTYEFAKTYDKTIDYNVFAYYGDDFEPEREYEFCKANGDVFWVYGQCWSNLPNSAEILRYEAGFYAWRIKTKGIGWWCYYLPSEDPYNDLDGASQDFIMSYLDADNKMLPTINWEAIRDGINDMKYLYTLEHYIQKAKTEKRKAELVVKGENLLEEIRNSIPLKKVYVLAPNWLKGVPDVYIIEKYRKRVIESIKELDDQE